MLYLMLNKKYKVNKRIWYLYLLFILFFFLLTFCLYFNITGDIIGTALQNLDRLLAMPYGCGEQNMVLFVPNIFILQYLEKTHQMTDEIKSKAIRFLKSGKALLNNLLDSVYWLIVIRAAIWMGGGKPHHCEGPVVLEGSGPTALLL